MNDELKIIVCNESTSQSIISDIFTFSSLVFVLFANFQWLGNNLFITFMIFAMFFLQCVTRANNKIKKMNAEECYEYLKKLKDDK